MDETPAGRYLFETASLVLGLVTGIISYVFRQDLQLSLILGFVVGVGLLTVKVLAELTRVTGAGDRAERTLAGIETSLRHRDRYLTTLDHVGGDLPRSLERIHAGLATVPPELFGVAAQLLEDPLDQLERRHIVTSAESSSLNTHLVRTFRSDVFTTSVLPMHFWLTPYGQNYNDAICARLAELAATGHPARFRRVYIVRDSWADQVHHGPYADVIRRQQEAGINVRVTVESLLPTDLRRDFGVWDARLEVELEVDGDGYLIRRHYRYSADAVAAAERRAEQIWDRSTDFATWTTLLPRPGDTGS
ncbi:DUF6879 family protein [Actinoplanes sp. RD1]|uniref:DUF6879 family protein n=1 Tax=Actinoplanes sp. RD1 TaxID=3064538 RepID=UPI0027427F98|nr:DUF6879 family protein [Actinoplanes sp. RD1]